MPKGTMTVKRYLNPKKKIELYINKNPRTKIGSIKSTKMWMVHPNSGNEVSVYILLNK